MLLPEQDLDGVEVGTLARLFTPAALHQDTELLTVTVEAEGGAEGWGATMNHCLHNLCWREGGGALVAKAHTFSSKR